MAMEEEEEKEEEKEGTKLWRRGRIYSNPGHIASKQALPTLRHPRFAEIYYALRVASRFPFRT